MPLELRTARVGDVARISQLHADLWRVSHAAVFDEEFIEDPLEEAMVAHWQALLRGRGIGRSLLGLIAQRLRNEGARAATLAVPAGQEDLPKLAKRFGGVLGPAVTRERLGHPMPERSINWADISRLIAACAG